VGRTSSSTPASPTARALNRNGAAVKAAGARRGGFVNAVLRAIVRAGRFRSFPEEIPAGFPRRIGPRDLDRRVVGVAGEAETRAYLAACIENPPSRFAQPVPCRNGCAGEAIADEGKDPSPAGSPRDGFILEARPVFSDAAFLKGRTSSWDEGAQLIARCFIPDRASGSSTPAPAPGGRRPTCPPSPEGKRRSSRRRLRLAPSNAGAMWWRGPERAGIRAALHDLSRAPLTLPPALRQGPGGRACTGMGVIRRNPDAKWRSGGRPRRMARSSGDPAKRVAAPARVLPSCTCRR